MSWRENQHHQEVELTLWFGGKRTKHSGLWGWIQTFCTPPVHPSYSPPAKYRLALFAASEIIINISCFKPEQMINTKVFVREESSHASDSKATCGVLDLYQWIPVEFVSFMHVTHSNRVTDPQVVVMCQDMQKCTGTLFEGLFTVIWRIFNQIRLRDVHFLMFPSNNVLFDFSVYVNNLIFLCKKKPSSVTFCLRGPTVDVSWFCIWIIYIPANKLFDVSIKQQTRGQSHGRIQRTGYSGAALPYFQTGVVATRGITAKNSPAAQRTFSQ